MTEKEKLYEWVSARVENGGAEYRFPEIEEGMESYFEDIYRQPQLEEYDIQDLASIKEKMDLFFDESLSEIKITCMIAYLKAFHELKEHNKSQDVINEKRSGVPEFIYNF